VELPLRVAVSSAGSQAMFCSDAVQSGADSLFGESLSIWPVAEIRTEASSSSIGTATLVGYGLLNCR